jgi:DNA repair exonuclease SbcCD ATPase subunit
LSGGQKVILALAIRLAMGADELGFLALDEPTMYLDRRAVGRMEPVLDWLRRTAAARELQCLIVTHEEGLLPMFDGVLRL